jgi:outer membrane protein OmpA-like peptidoglycan-associated protein
MYYGIDASVKYSFMSLIKSKVIDPSLHLGGGYTFFGDKSSGTVNSGAGLTFWFTENVGLALATTYKWGFGDDSPPLDRYKPEFRSVFQHTVGITFQLGGKDTDGDGIYDKNDACPEVAGLKQFNGCPDTDADGIIDRNDGCPDVFGLAALDGCPDTDGDGIADKDDACPEVAGLAALNGCPDTDGDGIADKDDACTEVAGLAVFEGCPDTDKDGIADKDDKCPTVAGPNENSGCPILDADKDGVPDLQDDSATVAGPASNKGYPENIESFKIQAKSVFFDKNKSTFKAGDAATIASLDAMREILRNYPNAKFSIQGHTDNDGSDAFNQKLSEDRANAVRNALIEKGIKPENLVAVGFGETKPIASNKTKEGKAQNRRTEVIEIFKIQARSVFFDTNKSTFKAGDAATIASLVAMREILRNYPNAKFSIEGHTDSDGSNAFNQKLSEDRANAVRNALIEKGVKPENLVVVGFGETKPIDSNKTKEGKAKNRRTEVRHEGK